MMNIRRVLDLFIVFLILLIFMAVVPSDSLLVESKEPPAGVSDILPMLTEDLSEKEEALDAEDKEIQKQYDKSKDIISFPKRSPFLLVIPSLDIESLVYRGEFSAHSDPYKLVILDSLDKSDGSTLKLNWPGEHGVAVIGGHDLKSGELFGRLEDININDEVILTSSDKNRRLTYKVSKIIPYQEKYALTNMFYSQDSKLILLTCSYRIGEPKTRFIVICNLGQ